MLLLSVLRRLFLRQHRGMDFARLPSGCRGKHVLMPRSRLPWSRLVPSRYVTRVGNPGTSGSSSGWSCRPSNVFLEKLILR